MRRRRLPDRRFIVVEGPPDTALADAVRLMAPLLDAARLAGERGVVRVTWTPMHEEMLR